MLQGLEVTLNEPFSQQTLNSVSKKRAKKEKPYKGITLRRRFLTKERNLKEV